jgi:hypothetical protein
MLFKISTNPIKLLLKLLIAFKNLKLNKKQSFYFMIFFIIYFLFLEIYFIINSITYSF